MRQRREASSQATGAETRRSISSSHARIHTPDAEPKRSSHAGIQTGREDEAFINVFSPGWYLEPGLKIDL